MGDDVHGSRRRPSGRGDVERLVGPAVQFADADRLESVDELLLRGRRSFVEGALILPGLDKGEVAWPGILLKVFESEKSFLRPDRRLICLQR